jgi:hypothetical protein
MHQLSEIQAALMPAPGLDLLGKDAREQLSETALRGFFRIMELWAVKDSDARMLLGGVSNVPYYAWKRQPPRLLDADVLMRISYLVGIFDALNTIYGEKLADDWVRLPNSNRVFGGETPLAVMMQGGIPAMLMVRRLLDARRA